MAISKKKTKKEKIIVEKRKVLGRKVKKLREEGILPANVYGKKVKSLSVKLALKDFSLVYEAVGETGLVELKIKGEDKARPVLIHNVQLHPVTDQVLHANFYQVDLKQKVTTEIPLELVGESLAVEKKIGILIQPLTEIEVEALPADLPNKFDLDISGLKAVGDLITVVNLKIPEKVKILTGAKEILAKINPPAKEEEVAPSPEETAAEEEKPGEEKQEGEVGKEPKAEKETKKEVDDKPEKSVKEKPAKEKK